jgi:hypothetical protein
MEDQMVSAAVPPDDEIAVPERLAEFDRLMAKGGIDAMVQGAKKLLGPPFLDYRERESAAARLHDTGAPEVSSASHYS